MISIHDIDVVILCGGLGKRLRGVIDDRPKPMAEIDGRPFLDIIIDYVVSFGFRRFIFCTGYMGEVIRQHYKDRRDIEILFSEESVPLGTGGAVKNAEALIKSDPFLVMNGDSFCPADLSQFFEFHMKKGALASLVVVKTEESEDFGLITMGVSQRIVEFKEKQGQGGSFINAGVYLFQKRVLSMIPQGTSSSLENDIFPELVREEIYGYETKGKLTDIGTPERLDLAKKQSRDFNDSDSSGRRTGNPLVSVITISLNSAKTIEQAIRSVLGQDYPHIEHVIVDGSSTDGTVEIIKKYDNGKVKWVSEPDRGPADASNKGLRMASGEIIGVLQSDDYFEQGAIRAVVDAFKVHPDIDIVQGNLRRWNLKENAFVIVKPPSNPHKAALRAMPFSYITSFIKRRLYDKYGLLDTSPEILATDYDIALRFLKNGANLFHIDQVVTNMRRGGTSDRWSLIEKYMDLRNIALKNGYSWIKVNLNFLYWFFFYSIEINVGIFLRKIGFGRVADLYRKLVYPHVPKDYC